MICKTLLLSQQHTSKKLVNMIYNLSFHFCHATKLNLGSVELEFIPHPLIVIVATSFQLFTCNICLVDFRICFLRMKRLGMDQALSNNSVSNVEGKDNKQGRANVAIVEEIGIEGSNKGVVDLVVESIATRARVY